MPYPVYALNAASQSHGNLTANSEGATANTIPNDGQTFVVFQNTAGASRTVTATGSAPCRFGTIHPISLTIPAGERRIMGPFPIARFGRVIALSFDDMTQLALYVFRAGA